MIERVGTVIIALKEWSVSSISPSTSSTVGAYRVNRTLGSDCQQSSHFTLTGTPKAGMPS